MKSLSLNTPLLIIVTGLPGAGKSFFARRFSDTFSVPLMSYNQLRHIIFAKNNYDESEHGLLTDIMDYQIGELLKTGNSIIIDGGCDTHKERQKYDRLARSKGYGSLIVWVQIDEPTARHRATKRNQSRDDDKFNTSLTPEQFDRIYKLFEPPEREEHVVISGKHTYNTQAKMILRKLSAPRANQAAAVHSQSLRQVQSRKPAASGYGDIKLQR